jgi:hypothetical protein
MWRATEKLGVAFYLVARLRPMALRTASVRFPAPGSPGLPCSEPSTLGAFGKRADLSPRADSLAGAVSKRGASFELASKSLRDEPAPFRR